MFDFLVSCLQERFRPAYELFYQQRCLKFLAMQPVSSWSASLFRAYVIGITRAIQLPWDDPEENQTISQAIDRLHEPENLFVVCSTLAMYPHDSIPENTGEDPNIEILTALAQIRPLDPAWGNCRRRLRALAEDENCFVGSEGEATEIEKRRCTMRVAIKTLEVFFSDMPQVTASLALVQLLPTLLSLDVAEESLARAATTSVLVRSCRSPATLASTATTG